MVGTVLRPATGEPVLVARTFAHPTVPYSWRFLVQTIAQSATHDLLIERHAAATIAGVVCRLRREVWRVGQADVQIFQLGRPATVKRHLGAGADRPTTANM